VRDWTAFVRARLSLETLTAERELRIVRELAAQLEDFYRDARARGATETEADAYACGQIRDWAALARDVVAIDRRHVQRSLDRLADSLEHFSPERPGVLLMLAHVLTDTRYALRQMRKTPGFTLVAVLTLAFGIGATSAIFSVVNAVMLKPLPYPDQDRLVMVYEVLPQYGRFAVAPENFQDWRARNQVFERIATFGTGFETLVGSERPERINRAAVSWDIFELLGAPPMLGRGFRAEEDAPEHNNVVVLSYGLWHRRFGGDPSIIGQSLTLSGTPSTVVGVMREDFYFPNRSTEFWRPIALPATGAGRGRHYLGTIARLKPGVSLEQASAEMRTIATQLAQEYPNTNRDESAEVIRMHELIAGPVRPMLLTLLAAVGVVVLIACANVANLLLVRASVREREMAIRAALGAGGRRLVGQMLSEGIVLAGAGGLLGVLLAYVAITPIRTLGRTSIPRVADVALDGNVVAFVLLVTVLTGLLFSVAPAWHAARVAFGGLLKEGARGSSARGHRVRSVLLVGEVALSIVLLVGAALLLRSFARLSDVDPGFRPEHVLAFSVGLPQSSYPEAHQRAALFDRLLERLRALPGVQHAGMVQTIPIRSDHMHSFTIQGRPPNPPGADPSANYRVASPDYFAALSIPVRRGRTFTPADTEMSPRVAVIDEAFARQHFANEDPVGRGIDIGDGTDGFYEIVGIVGSVHHEGLHVPPRPTMYIPFRQNVFSTMWIMMRTPGDPMALANDARHALREIDPTLPAAAMAPLANVIDESIAQRRFSMLLLAVFAAVALFLAAVGLYGVIAYAVSQRTQEIGLRMAIGAQRSDVLRMVLGDGMKLAAVGVVFGLGAAMALARYTGSMLFGVTPLDAVSYAATAAVMLGVSALACYVPARRASAVDPLQALRTQ
jgi:putative ABC transport system permease protein